MDCSEKSLIKSLGKLECRIQELLKSCKFPGLAVGIRYRQEIIFQQTYGVRDCSGNPVELNSQFQLGNASIPLLALWAAKKAEEEKWCPNQPLWTLGDIRFLGPDVAFTGTIIDILTHQVADKIYEGYAGALSAWKASHNGHDIDYTQLNPCHGSYSCDALSILRGLETDPEVKSENYELVQQLALLLAKHLSVDLKTELLTFIHNYLGLTSIQYGKDDYLASPNPALNQVNCKHKGNKHCGCGSGQCCWECKYTFDGDNRFAALGASGNIMDMLKLVEIVLNQGTLSGQEKICVSALTDFLAPRVRGLNQPECGHWFYSLGWKTRFYNNQEIIYNQAFLETGGRALTFMVPKSEFGITILSNSLNPVPEALAAYAFYLIVCGDCKEAEKEFQLAWNSVKRYIRLNRDESAEFDPPTGLSELIIDPVGVWVNSHFGILQVTKDNGQYKFQYKDFLPVVGQHLIANVWRFYYDDKHGINRVFQVNFTYNALFQAELAHAFTNDTQFTLTLQKLDNCQACGYLCGSSKNNSECIAAAKGSGGCGGEVKCVYDKCGCCYTGRSCCGDCNKKYSHSTSSSSSSNSSSNSTFRVSNNVRSVSGSSVRSVSGGNVNPIQNSLKTTARSSSSSSSNSSSNSNSTIRPNSNYNSSSNSNSEASSSVKSSTISSGNKTIKDIKADQHIDRDVSLKFSGFGQPVSVANKSGRCSACQRKPCRCASIRQQIAMRK